MPTSWIAKINTSNLALETRLNDEIKAMNHLRYTGNMIKKLNFTRM